MKLLNLLFILFTGSLWAQNYIPIDTADRAKRDLAAASFKNSGDEFIKFVKTSYPKKVGKIMALSYEEFYKDFEKQIKDGSFVYDVRFSSYIDKILNQLKQGNPNIPKDLRVLISKDPSLNAYCLPNGTFVLNMGLFYWLDNDDEVASVLAHELSHNILKHSLKRGEAMANDELSSNNKNQIKSIQKQKYNKSRAALELYRNKLYTSGDLRKKNEFQADSLGLIIMKNSPFNEGAFVDALELMEEYDSIKPSGLKEDIYRKIFSLPNQPFKDDWLKREDFSNYDYSLYKEKIDKDSIATHPEIEDRINKLRTYFPGMKENDIELKPSKELEELQKIAKYEQVPSLYFFEQYGAGIYICLYYLQKDPENQFYKEWLGKCFEKIYEGRKTYRLNRYLDRIEPKDQSESYQQFLSFMWNLSLDEIKNISEFYNSKKAPE
ncbi:peptidase M48 [Apibacter muscae]|uniref:M48 family metallopeptidase n=1 Tax=Apibacter muscae TaxID=2509004 RepID=UPI0011AD6D29|nr:M48 family metallopeptidase [Apibacter muscae]TWP30055.1 peptidase M48 [Apibacter muscae]